MAKTNGKPLWLSAVKGRGASMFRAICIPIGARNNMKPLLGKKLNNYLAIVKKMKANVYYDKRELGRLGKLVLKKIKDDKNFLQKHLLNFKKSFKTLVVNAEMLFEIDYSIQSNSQLGILFSSFVEEYQNLTPFMTTPHLVQLALEEKIKEMIKKHNLKEGILFDLSIPYQQTFETTQQKELLKIIYFVFRNQKLKKIIFKKEKLSRTLKKMKNDYPKFYQLIQEHEKRWAWIGMEDYLRRPLNKKRLLKIIYENLKIGTNPRKKLFDLEKNQKKMLLKAKKAVNKIKPLKGELVLINLLQKYAWLRTARLEAFRKAFFFTKPLILEIAKRANLSENDIYSLTPDEIITFLNEKQLPSSKMLGDRKKGLCNLNVGRKIKIIFWRKMAKKI